MRPYVALALLAIVGCGGQSDAARLKSGSPWLTDIPTTPCQLSMDFQDGPFGDGRYDVRQVCPLDNGQTAVVSESGEFAVLPDGEIEFEPTQASCPLASDPYVYGYAFTDDNLLELTTSLGGLALRPDDGTGGPSSGTSGCFNANGMFEPRPVAPL